MSSGTDITHQDMSPVRRVRRLLDDADASLVGRRVLVLCSGGADSVAAAWLLAQLPRGAAPASIDVLWCDHALRADVAGERAAAAAVADRIGATLHERRADIDLREDADGVEGAARRWRYEQARDLAGEIGCDIVCTGHTADDQLEQVLLALAGVTGASGDPDAMRVARELAPALRLVRPLLSTTRAQVEAVLTDSRLSWAVDPTNADPDAHVRNAVRHRVVPELLALHPGAGSSLVRSGERRRTQVDTARSLALALLEAWGSTGDRIDLRRLARLDAAPRREVLAAWLLAACPGRGIGPRQVEAVDRIALAPARAACARVDLPGDACVRRDGYDLVITTAPRPERPTP